MNYNFPQHINNDTFNEIVFNLRVDGSPVDLTDCVIKMQLRRQSGLPVALELISPTQIEITEPLSGVFKIKTQVISLANPCQYKYDMQFTFPDGKVKTYVEGIWIIKPGITV